MVRGKPVQNVTVQRVLLLQPVRHDADDDVVGDERARVDVRLGELAELGALFDILAEDVTRRDVRDVILFRDQRGLGALACTRRAEHDYVFHSVLTSGSPCSASSMI